MSILPKVKVKKPGRSNYDLSRAVRFTAAAGPIYPVVTEFLLPGDKVEISCNTMVKTLPLSVPVMGEFIVETAVFFDAWRNYMPEWRRNRKVPIGESLEEFVDADFPHIVIRPNDPFVSSPGSLFDFLGFPVGFSVPGDGWIGYDSSSPLFSPLVTDDGYGHVGIGFSAFPFLTYYNIFYNYYTNQQENRYFSRLNYANDGNDNDRAIQGWQSMPLNDVVNLIDYFDSSRKTWCLDDSQNWSTVMDQTVMYSSSPMSGLMLRCYKPDMFTTVLNKSNVEDAQERVFIDVSDGKLGMSQFRIGHKVDKFVNRSLLVNSRFGELIRAHYGVRTDEMLTIPEYIGTWRSEIRFGEVIQSAPGVKEDGSYSPTGSLSGRGVCTHNGRNMYFTASEYGTLMFVFTIVPKVDYSQGISKHLFKRKLSDVFFPEFNGLGYQEVFKYELDALPTYTGGSTYGNPDPLDQDLDMSIGYQPSWQEYRTSVNRVHGQFADKTSDLSDWVLTRDFNRLVLSDGTDDGYATTYFDYTAYCFPEDWNYIFADNNAYADNFHCQLGVKMHIKRLVSKVIQPTL